MSSDDQDWKLTVDEASRYADQLRAMAASQERRALLAQELEACAVVITAQAARIAELETELAQHHDPNILTECHWCGWVVPDEQ